MKYFLLCLLLSTGAAFGQQNSLSLIPEPASVSIQKGQFRLTQTTSIVYNNAAAKQVAALLNEFIFARKGYRLPLRESAAKTANAIRIEQVSAQNPEAYSLAVSPAGVLLSGDNAGIFYGIQTIQQLLPVEPKAAPVLPAVVIKDEPRFGYRGLMLDVSRHYFPVSYIKKFIDVMAHLKLNRFHWHLTDDQGWRIEIKKFPALQTVGAWREPIALENNSPYIKDGRYGGYFTQEEVKEVIAYADQRYITIVPEIEMPGHAGAALAAYPALGCTGGPYKVGNHPMVNQDVFCAGNEETFHFLEGVIDEVTALFPGKYIHIGGDETPKERWAACTKCQFRMKTEKLKDEHHLQSYFIQRMEKYINSKGKNIVGWDEILEGGLAPNATVMSWRGETGGIEAARQNHDVIMSPYTYVYFDYYQGKPEGEPAAANFLPLANVYKYEPLPASLTKEQHHFIKGIQANLWTEFVPTEAHADYMEYPRGLALAEIAWSPATKKDYARFTEKLQARLLDLDTRKVNFRIPEPVLVKDQSTTEQFSLLLKPSVKGAVTYYTTDGSEPTRQSRKLTGAITHASKGGAGLTLKTLTVLSSGREGRVQTLQFEAKKPSASATPDTKK